MMNNIIICEGSSDYALLQYLMRRVHCWKDCSQGVEFLNPSRTLCKHEKKLVMGVTRGVGGMLPSLRNIIKINRNEENPEACYKKIIVMIDKDDCCVEERFLFELKVLLESEGVHICTECTSNNSWIKCQLKNWQEFVVEFEILPLIIPFEEIGALETFLLSAIGKEDEYDKVMIDKCKKLVDTVDYEERYLKHRGDILKAVFNVYFSVRTPKYSFIDRQNIFLNTPWEKYEHINTTLKELSYL